MGLGAFRTKFLRELSTGSRRIVDLACVVAHRPTVILFDEPSSGIAQRETEALGPLLLRIREGLGAALLVIEHDMPLVSSVSDRLDRDGPGPGHRRGPARRRPAPTPSSSRPTSAPTPTSSPAPAPAPTILNRPSDQPATDVQQHQGDPSHGTSNRPVRRLRGEPCADGGRSSPSSSWPPSSPPSSSMGRRRRRSADDGGDGGTGEQATDVTTADGEPIYPFSWADGEAAGLPTSSSGATGATPSAAPLAIPDVSARRRATSRSRATTAAPPTRASPPTRSRSCVYLGARRRPGHQLHHRRDRRWTTPTPISRTPTTKQVDAAARRTTRPTAARWRSSTT